MKFVELVINAHHRSHGDTVIHKLNIIPNPTYDYNNFYATYTSYGEQISEVIGIGGTLNAIPKRDPVEIKKKKSRQFMRWCIGYLINDIRLEELAKNPECKICGCAVDNESCHLDHCGEVEFRHIAEAWLDVNIDKINFRSIPGNCDVFTDEDLMNDWYKFHKENAKFQLTCIQCNLTKSKK